MISTSDVFVGDRQSGVTDRGRVASDGTQGHEGFAFKQICASSGDGRFVAFDSTAAILVAGDTNGSSDVFVHDRSNGVTERVSVGPGGVQGQGPSGLPSISADGRYVAFDSSAPNLVSGDSNSQDDVFVRDRRQGTTERVNVSSGGAQANGESLGPAPISSDGRLVAFNSYASNLVAGDLNHVFDIFTHDRAATGFTSLCTPGFDVVVPSPCSNPASGFGMGCDNSAATGGA